MPRHPTGYADALTFYRSCRCPGTLTVKQMPRCSLDTKNNQTGSFKRNRKRHNESQMTSRITNGVLTRKWYRCANGITMSQDDHSDSRWHHNKSNRWHHNDATNTSDITQIQNEWYHNEVTTDDSQWKQKSQLHQPNSTKLRLFLITCHS